MQVVPPGTHITELAHLIALEIRKQSEAEADDRQPLLLEPEGVQRIELEMTEYAVEKTQYPPGSDLQAIDLDFTPVLLLGDGEKMKQKKILERVIMAILALAVIIPIGFVIGALVGKELTVREYAIAIDEIVDR